MANFIKPSVEVMHRDYIGRHVNNPVNIDFCTELVRRNEPDGYGKEYPVIHFKGCDVKWYYYVGGQEIRDKQYNDILNKFGELNT